jgi:selenide, water dikinase
MRAQPILQQDLVFVGGGHAHAIALRMLAMNPIEGLRITLVSPASHTPYSGMLPGLVAGHYTFEETHIDLARLCQWAGVRFIAAEVTALDTAAKTLTLSGRPTITYDVVSIDIGSQPELDSVPGARAHSVPVKPVAGLWQRWRELQGRLADADDGTALRLAVVGGGAGSVELILAMAHALRGRNFALDLWCGATEILQNYNSRARAAAMAALGRHGVAVHLGCRVAAVEDAALVLEDGTRHLYDELFWCTGAAASPWVADSGLATDQRGFLEINDALHALDDEHVFGAGDIAVQVNHPRPKAGVYAVRQGPVLAHNLRASLLGRPLKRHHPQQAFLSLVSLGDRQATADKGLFSATGGWVWNWKDRIDREFMGRFEKLPAMAADSARDVLPGTQAPGGKLHCGGCGAKVGARGLTAVLADLAREFPDHCAPSGERDDAAIIPRVVDAPVLQSLDQLRQIVADPWIMGRIAANHALSDLYACGAQPVSALASISLPFASGSLLQRDLYQLLAGALHEFSHVDCVLGGGHSMQGPELTVGFAVNGQAISPERGQLPKRGLVEGDVLILTKPLGTGVIFAAHMEQQADGRHVQAAVDMMLQSNFTASLLGVKAQVSACTDVTGFGLLGHLVEMLLPGQRVVIHPDQVPAIDGAADYLAAGMRSSMHEANADAAASRMGAVPPGEALLCDPQTSGGLLFGIAPERAEALCVALQEAGYSQAAPIGRIESMPEGASPVAFQPFVANF